MAKINLLTIHWGNSYGGTMQTYATKRILESLGHSVTIINLVHPKLKNEILSSLYKSIALFVMTCWFRLFRKRNKFNLTKRIYEIDEKVIPPCDYIIIGSDQVWNKDITSPINKAYFLDFEKQSTKISLSSSFGKSIWNEDENYSKWVKKQLMDFKAISVREESGVKICNNVFGVKAIQLVDPTLAWGKYEDLIKNREVLHQIYPFLLLSNSDTQVICQKISVDLGLPLYKSCGYKHFLFQNPTEWLNRMRNSDFIVTDSFHGLAFCLIFHKNFIVLCADTCKFTRLLSLLKLVKLEYKYVKDIEDLNERGDKLYKTIDFTSVDKILELERRKFYSFLEENLQLSIVTSC